METTNLANQLPIEDKKRVAYALNLCSVSISQIIDSKDIVVLKQERETILCNLNLQNFVKHPALLEILRQILDTITYLEIQAGDLKLVEKEYQNKLKNAIWSAIPNPTLLLSEGNLATLAISVAVQLGTGYMNYRRARSEYADKNQRDEWELKRHEIEQLEGLRAQLFETAWRLSADYDFDDEYRLTQKQLSRYSEALLEPDALKRYERLDVMSQKFSAFPPFWYYLGNAAMEVYRKDTYRNCSFAAEYKEKAIQAYNQFHSKNMDFLREDVIAASCCLEHLSLLAPHDVFVEKLLQQAMCYAGDNYDILQQCLLVNLQLKRIDEIITPLREMVANNYNVALNGRLLSKIYIIRANRMEYEKLCKITDENNILPWSDDSSKSEKLQIDTLKSRIAEEYIEMAQQIIFSLREHTKVSYNSMYKRFKGISAVLSDYCQNSSELKADLRSAEEKLFQAIDEPNDEALNEFFEVSQQVERTLLKSDFSLQLAEKTDSLLDEMNQVTNNS